MTLRPDQKIISDWVQPNSHVLDLGCGDGTLLRHLMDARSVTGYGLEIKTAEIQSCVEQGVNVIRSNFDRDGLRNFEDKSFDYVVMALALQVSRYPDILLDEMLRVGHQGIVTFPNFGHWRARADLVRGRMPRTKALPSTWYNTKNIHLCTLNDFENLLEEKRIRIIRRAVVSHAHRRSIRSQLLPNLFAEVAMYQLGR